MYLKIALKFMYSLLLQKHMLISIFSLPYVYARLTIFCLKHDRGFLDIKHTRNNSEHNVGRGMDAYAMGVKTM